MANLIRQGKSDRVIVMEEMRSCLCLVVSTSAERVNIVLKVMIKSVFIKAI